MTKTNTKKYLIGLALAVVFLITANVHADLVYNLTKSKDAKAADLLPGFSFSLSEINDGAGARLTLNITDYGIEHGFLEKGKDEGVKFKDFKFSSDKIFESSGDWTQKGWTLPTDSDPYYVGTSVDLNFIDGLTWESFVADYAESFWIEAHMQSINGNDFDLGGDASINRATFTYAPSPDGDQGNSTPEPATLAILGLGLTGLGLVRRRNK